MDNKLSNSRQTVFEQIKRIGQNKSEYWTARGLSKVLEYSEYRHFKPVIDRAKEACSNSGYEVSDHFEDILDMIELGKGAKRETENVKLSRYACYLIVQNADPGKEIVALGQMPENLPVAGSIKKLDKKDNPKKLTGKKKK